jgi:transcriptional regulator CtsR
LHLTKEEISAQDLASQIGQDSSNLAKFTGPFTGKKGYLVEIKRGRNKYFVRGPMVDLVNIDDYEEFAKIIKSWESKITASAVNQPTESTPMAEQTEQKLD